MKEYEDIFVKDKKELGRTGITKHKIDTGNHEPIKQRAYRAIGERRKVIEEETRKMKERDVIEDGYGPWASPVVLIPKKNGEIRFCIDYRKLNGITKKDNHPLPRIDDMLDTFNGSEWFTTLDLASGYWQVEMNKEDKEKTAFITHEGLYQWKVMPFGLCNAPATFQRLMHKVLGNLIYTKAPVYIDDINVHSKSFNQHIEDLREVFGKLRKAKLKLRPDKCNFCYREIKFLGHIVGKDGIKVDQDKIKKVREFPKPENVSELRGFVGLASYYRKFIKDFSKITKPLTKLFQKDLEYVWRKEQEESFEALKEKLTTAPVLAYPDFEKEFTLYTDASGYALGAVLSQKGEDGKERVIEYASKGLTKAEQNYSTTELECYAIVWAIEEKFHHYLINKKFKVVTDHYALKWLQTNALKGRRARWILKLQPYDFEIIHKEGRKHKNADALSRIHEKEWIGESIKN
jgi:hypothetical protein